MVRKGPTPTMANTLAAVAPPRLRRRLSAEDMDAETIGQGSGDRDKGDAAGANFKRIAECASRFGKGSATMNGSATVDPPRCAEISR